MKNQRLVACVLLTVTLCALTLANSYSQGQRIGATPADAKMLPGGEPKSGAGMGSLYSPNFYDGTVSINIPIYQYQYEGADFGVSFGYNTRGVKLDEVASDIGLHFSINAGATIVRTMKDLPDEINILNADTIIYLAVGSVTGMPDPNRPPPPIDTVSLNKYWCFKGKYAGYFESAASKTDTKIYRDKEADDFTVTLSSGSFTFNLGKNGTVFTHPHRNVKIEPMWGNQPFTSIGDLQPIGQDYVTNNLMAFRITDESGYCYVFTRGEYEMRTIEDVYGKTIMVAAYNFSTEWVITEVILPNGSRIKYTYDVVERGPAVLPLYKSYNRMEGRPASFMGMSITEVTKKGWTMSKLKTIAYPNNVTVYFNYDNSRWRKDYPYPALREVRITTPQSCLSYIMKQSFFWAEPPITEKTYQEGTNPTETVATELKARLRLDAIVLNSCDSTIQEPYYSFSYDPLPLPPRLDYRQDFFGYFNDGSHDPFGATVEESRKTQIPFHYVFNNGQIPPSNVEGGLDRMSNIAKMKAGILNRITNAYGGYVHFTYKGHDLYNPLGNLPTNDPLYFGKDANDGLLVDSIVEGEHLHPEDRKITIIQYTEGQRFLAGGYFHYPDLYDGLTAPDYLASINMTGNFVTPHQLVSGSNHGYTEVNVKTVNSQGAQLARKHVVFTNFRDETSTSRYFVIGGGKDFFTYPYTDKQYLRDWELGLPRKITVYDQNDRVVSVTENKYRFTIDTTSMIGKVENIKESLAPISGVLEPGISNVYANKKYTDTYRPFTGKALLDTTIVKTYLSDNAYTTDMVRYTYDARNNPSIIITYNSKGQQVNTMQAYNYTVSASPGTTLYNMTAAGLEKTVSTERWLIGTGSGNNKLLEANLNTFDYQDGKLRPRHLYQTRIGQPLSEAQYATLGGASGLVNSAFNGSAINYFRKVSEVTQADARCNPLEVQLIGQPLYKATVWDTVTGNKIAEANAPYADIAFSGFDASNKGGWSYPAAGAINVANAMAGRNAYQFQSGPVTRSSFSQNKKYIVAFWASNYSGLPVCTIAGATVILRAGAIKGSWTYYEGRFTAPSATATLSLSGAANAYLDELRLFPADAGMQTWTYTDLFGVSATADASGRISYFEYDKLGRQVLVRDQEGNILAKTELHINQ